MAKFWCVKTTFDDRGRVTASITNSIESDEKPKSSSTSTKHKDIYNDWFGSVEEAQNFIEEAKRA